MDQEDEQTKQAREMREIIDKKRKERDLILQRFDATQDSVVKDFLKESNQFKSRAAMRRDLEERYRVPEDPYAPSNLKKKDYDMMQNMTLRQIMDKTDIQRKAKPFVDESFETDHAIESKDMIKITPKARKRKQKSKE